MKNLSKNIYTILILSHEPKILEMIETALLSLHFKFKLIYASTSIEAKKILTSNGDITLTLITSEKDKTLHSLHTVHYIRKELSNSMMRVVILDSNHTEINTNTINFYDINHLSNILNISVVNIFSVIRTSLIQYEQLLQLEYKEEVTYKKMSTDSLTRLSNRIKLNEDCNNKEEKTLILIDIIGFSKINENYGYDIGDSVLKEFAAFLYAIYHDNYNVYHLENDLFALMLTMDTQETIFTTVENIRADILKLTIITNNFNKTLDFSIGVAYQSEKNILRKAELALKEARSKGINKIKYYSEDLKIIQQIENTNFWAPIIQEHINNSTILVYYQPIYNLSTNTIYKHELLMRIEHKGTIYSPASFLNAAYQAGQMFDIFKFMFTQACIQAKKQDCKVSVNIGDYELKEEDIVEFIRSTLKSYKVNPSSISLEILEYNSIANDKLVKDNIIMIHKLGIEIAIDDFGVNCSNFGQLQGLPIDVIKIDGSFIKNIDTSKDSQIIVKTIQTYAKEKEIKLVAEFVTNEKVLKTITEFNIEYGQGNYLCEAKKYISEI